MARLKEIYNKEIVPALVKQFGYKSTMQVPRISKIVLNLGLPTDAYAYFTLWPCHFLR